MKNIDQSLPTLTEMNLVDLLLYDNKNFDDKKKIKKNAKLMCTRKFLKDFQRFAS